MKKWLYLLVIAFIYVSMSCSDKQSDRLVALDKIPNIFPEYNEVTVPCNIAPLNFIINEKGSRYIVRISGENGYSFKIKSKKPVIRINKNRWHKLLQKNLEKHIYISIKTKQENRTWECFQPVAIRISSSPIDPYIVFRKINPALVYWEEMSIVQRNIECFDESTILFNKNTNNDCMNCHTFNNGDPTRMILHLRMRPGGTIITADDTVYWFNTKTKYTLSACVYPSWHPEGRYIAFSTNTIYQNFQGSGLRHNHVRDNASDLVIFDLHKKEIFTNPSIATKDLENLPCWSPDGKFLYYIVAPQHSKDSFQIAQKYDLMRIAFNASDRSWGVPEIMLTSKETGMSVSFPEVSPDGKFLVFCMSDCGYFTIGNPTSDLYIMNIRTKEYSKLDINSNRTESFHSWSSNGRWLMFVSKRIDDLVSMPFFAYIDSTGKADKPFLLPFKNPEIPLTRIFNFNRPVFTKGKIKFNQKDLLKLTHSDPETVSFDTIGVDVNAIAGATKIVSGKEDDNQGYKKN